MPTLVMEAMVGMDTTPKLHHTSKLKVISCENSLYHLDIDINVAEYVLVCLNYNVRKAVCVCLALSLRVTDMQICYKLQLVGQYFGNQQSTWI